MDPVVLARRAGALAETSGRRIVIGICGPPGCGKSTLADGLVHQLGASAVVLGMDGFHLHDDELARLGLSQLKGAPQTFDVEGYAALLVRVREHPEATVYAPWFDRSRELSVAGAVAIRPEHRVVVTEGNYLLLDAPSWRDVARLLDESWYVDVEEHVRMRRLVDRHVAHGRSPEQARAWVARTDRPNAELIARTRSAADLVVTE